MIVRQIVAAAALALSAVAANAAPFLITSGSTDASGVFTDDYTFTSPGSFSLDALGESTAGGITSFEMFIKNGPQVTADAFNAGLYSYGLNFNSLSAGTYTFTVKAAPSSTIYISGEAGPERFVSSTPVPEPETYAMAIAGLGVLGLMARRRARA